MLEIFWWIKPKSKPAIWAQSINQSAMLDIQLLWHYLVKECLFSIDAYVVSSPTCTQNLRQSLMFRHSRHQGKQTILEYLRKFKQYIGCFYCIATYSHLSNKRGAHAYCFWKIPPSTKKNPPSTFIDSLDFFHPPLLVY